MEPKAKPAVRRPELIGRGTAVGYTKKRREATTGVLGIAVVLVLLAAAASLRWTSRLP